MPMTEHEPELLTVSEVADYMRVGEETVRRWLRDSELAGIHLGRGASWRVRRSDLETFIRDRTTGQSRQT